MQFEQLKRRDFIALLANATVWPLAAGAQQPDRMRRIAVLMSPAADDPEGQTRFTALKQGLEKLGWAAGRNLQIDYRWGVDAGDMRAVTTELLRQPLVGVSQ